ncbi:MAG: SNF2-related protein [Burkholderiales bacterium]
MHFNPRDYQRALRDFALDVPRCQWWAGTGVGKTASALELVSTLLLLGEARHVLVVSTKRIARMVWDREITKWSNFKHIDISVAVGTPAERIAAIKQRATITTINYDNLQWLVDTVGEHWYWDMVIADESTRLKGLRIDMRRSSTGKVFARRSGGGKRAFDLARVSHKRVRRWINMTGTPLPNGLVDLWGQAWYVDAGARLGRSFTAFKERWFQQVRVGSDPWDFRLEPLRFAEQQIKDAIRDVTITIDAKDYFDLPPLVTNVVPVKLPPQAYSQYRQMEKEFFAEIYGHDIEAVSSGSKSMKCRQIASGAAYTDDAGNWIAVHDAKLDAVEDIVNELNGASVLIAYYFKSDLARLQKRFPKGRYFDDNPRTLDDFIRGRFQALFIHPQSGGHGIDGMQNVCNNIVVFSQTWDLESLEQVIERIGPTRQAQSGMNRPCYVHHIIAEGTIEEDMQERCESKASVQDAVRSAMKKRG